MKRGREVGVERCWGCDWQPCWGNVSGCWRWGCGDREEEEEVEMEGGGEEESEERTQKFSERILNFNAKGNEGRENNDTWWSE